MMQNLLSKHFSKKSIGLLSKLFRIKKQERNILTIWNFKSYRNTNTYNSNKIMSEYSKITKFKRFHNKHMSKALLLQVSMTTLTDSRQKIVFKEWLMKRNIET